MRPLALLDFTLIRIELGRYRCVVRLYLGSGYAAVPLLNELLVNPLTMILNDQINLEILQGLAFVHQLIVLLPKAR